MTAIERPYTVYLLLLTCLAFSSASAQPLSDSAFYKQSHDALVENQKNATGPNSRLYIGAEYIRNGRKAKGSAFYQSDDPLKGTIYYNDALYPNISLQYDLVLDALVINDYAGGGNIQLVKEKLGFFSIPGHYFVFIAPDRSSSSFMKPGYYEQLYKDGIGVYARHEKRLVMPSNLEDQPRYEADNFYFVRTGDDYHKVESRGALLDLLKDKKDLLKKYIRTNKLDFGRDWEGSLVKTAAYYAQIKN
jgi:hypothetical protein